MLLQIIFVFILCFISAKSAFAQVYYTESGHVEFHSKVPLHSFTGKSNHLVGKIDLGSSVIDFYVDVTTLKTGIGMRDNDMLKTLKAKKYTFASFYGKLISDFNPESNHPQKAIVQGKFKVHGISNPVKISGILQKTDEGLKLKAQWKLNMTDYKIEPPHILFYRVNEIVDVNIEALLPPKK